MTGFMSHFLQFIRKITHTLGGDVNLFQHVVIWKYQEAAAGHHRTVLTRSHMGKKIDRAKKPTTAARSTINTGPMVSDMRLTE